MDKQPDQATPSEADIDIVVDVRRPKVAGRTKRVAGPPTSLRDRLKRLRRRPELDASTYAAYRLDIEEATVEIIRKDASPVPAKARPERDRSEKRPRGPAIPRKR